MLESAFGAIYLLRGTGETTGVCHI